MSFFTSGTFWDERHGPQPSLGRRGISAQREAIGRMARWHANPYDHASPAMVDLPQEHLACAQI